MNNIPRTIGLLALAAGGLVAIGGALPASMAASGPASLTSIAGVSLPSRALYDGTALALPTRLAVAGDRVIVLDAFAEQAVHVIDAGTGALIESIGSRGEGPGEFEGARSIDVAPDGRSFWVYDLNQQRSTLYDLAPPEEYAAHRERDVVTYADASGLLEPIRIGDRKILASGLFEKGRLGHLDLEGRVVRESGELPPAPRGLPPHLVQFVHQGALRGTPSRDRFALSSMYFSRIELFDRHGTSLGVVDAPVELRPEIETSRRGDLPSAAVSSEAPAGYIDIAVTDEAIFALFSGRDPVTHREDSQYGDQVHVFRWTGDYVGVFDLGYDAIAIAVSDDAKTLYGVRHFPSVEVRAHEVPSTM